MKILSADDHWVVRAGLKHILRDLKGAEVIEAASFPDAMSAAQEHTDLDLIILDLLMPGNTPFAGLQELREAAPNVPIIVFSIIESREEVLRSIDLGAMGYISKATKGDEIVAIIRRVLAGEIWVPKELLTQGAPAVMQERMHFETDARKASSIEELTNRQRQVFDLLSQGKSNRHIALDLGVSEHTVRVHMTAILRALGVENRTQAAVLAAGYQFNESRGRITRRS
ncbi:MAG: response regulator [Alphaproteobacteria bacterium]